MTQQITLTEAQGKLGTFLGSQKAFLSFPTPAQIDRAQVRKIFMKVLSGGWGCGKTRIGLTNGLLLSALFPGNEGLVGRFHGKDLEDSVIPLFFEICPESWIARCQNRGKTGMTVRLTNSSIIYFRHIHDAGSGGTKSRRVGSNLGWFFFDQVEEATQTHWETMMGRLRNPKALIKMGLGAANPNGRDWVQKLFFPDWKPLDPENGVFFRTYQKGNMFGVHVDSEENREMNGGFVTDEYYDNMIANMSPDMVARYIHASMEDFRGKVYKGYSFDSVHNIDPLGHIPSHWECVVPIDVGGSCPWAVAPMYSDEYGNLIITDGFNKVTARTQEVGDWIKTHTPWNEARTTFVIDPENKLAASELADMGIYCRVAEKKVHEGTLRVASYFHIRKNEKPPKWFYETQSPQAVKRAEEGGSPRIFIYKTNIACRREHDEVVWDDRKPNTIKKTHERRFDYVDAVRYGVATKPDASRLPTNEDPYAEIRKQAGELAARESASADREIAEMLADQQGQGTREMFHDQDFDALIAGAGAYASQSKSLKIDWD